MSCLSPNESSTVVLAASLPDSPIVSKPVSFDRDDNYLLTTFIVSKVLDEKHGDKFEDPVTKIDKNLKTSSLKKYYFTLFIVITMQRLVCFSK